CLPWHITGLVQGAAFAKYTASTRINKFSAKHAKDAKQSVSKMSAGDVARDRVDAGPARNRALRSTGLLRYALHELHSSAGHRGIESLLWRAPRCGAALR
ncbi:MAG: hypothetical protein KDI60_18085, partial [Xanthomonadales bacterium]|nr:hypothetical protein [Xanthomonadales bacterium]